jgi:hypothetical protein
MKREGLEPEVKMMATVKMKAGSGRVVSAKEMRKKGKPLSVEEEYALNCEVARRIMQEAKQGSGKWRMGQYIALSKGQVVARSRSLEEVSNALRRNEPDHYRGMVFEVRDPEEVIRD